MNKLKNTFAMEKDLVCEYGYDKFNIRSQSQWDDLPVCKVHANIVITKND